VQEARSQASFKFGQPLADNRFRETQATGCLADQGNRISK
jgi:hypothetical protein